MDERLRRVTVTVLPKPAVTTVAETILGILRRRPDLGGWDWIIDIRNPHEKATAEEIDQIAAAFNAHSSRQSFTVFVSEDPATYDRCAMMGTKFKDRCHLVAKTVAMAESLLPRPVLSI